MCMYMHNADTHLLLQVELFGQFHLHVFIGRSFLQCKTTMNVLMPVNLFQCTVNASKLCIFVYEYNPTEPST